MYAFFDANVYLSFYQFGKDDIETMKKVVRLIKEGELNVITNQQLLDEFERNRHAKISEAFKPLQKERYGSQFPNYCSNYETFTQLKSTLREANLLLQQLTTDINSDIENRELEADKLIASIFEESVCISLEPEIIGRAQRRMALRNPPGKAGSLGDAIHWECLLEYNASSVCLVSQDQDFSSILYPARIDPFLRAEWHETHGDHAQIELFETINAFLKSKYPDFALEIEDTKDQLILQLNGSESFKETHAVVGKLNSYGSFTSAQATKLCEALAENSQVHLIATDRDLQNLYKSLIGKAWLMTSEDTMLECERHLEWDRGTLGIPF